MKTTNFTFYFLTAAFGILSSISLNANARGVNLCTPYLMSNPPEYKLIRNFCFGPISEYATPTIEVGEILQGHLQLETNSEVLPLSFEVRNSWSESFINTGRAESSRSIPSGFDAFWDSKENNLSVYVKINYANNRNPYFSKVIVFDSSTNTEYRFRSF